MEDKITVEEAAYICGIFSDPSIKCPRCGNALKLDTIGTSFTITCTKGDCIKYTGRGI